MQPSDDPLERFVTRYRERMRPVTPPLDRSDLVVSRAGWPGPKPDYPPIEGPGPVFIDEPAHHGCPHYRCTSLEAFTTELELDEHYRNTHMMPSPW